MQRYTDVSLQKYNSFGIDASARELVIVENSDEIPQLIEEELSDARKHLILGGGNNVVFAGNFDGTAVHLSNKGIEKISEDSDSVFVKAEAGEIWDDFVWKTIGNGWFGLENLVAIPSTIGATAVQNIGAYGSEAKDFIHEVHAYDLRTAQKRVFSNSECRFGYRDSFFKTGEGKNFIISSVVYKLNRKPEVKLNYAAIVNYLKDNNITDPSPRQLAECITSIRWQKLPKPEEMGSAGSFFKNPVVTPSHHADLKAEYPDMVSYPAGDKFKLAAGWMIEKSGWKGKQLGRAGVYEKQALVLVNCGGCTGEDVIRLANAVTADVEAMFGVRLEPEAIIVK